MLIFRLFFIFLLVSVNSCADLPAKKKRADSVNSIASTQLPASKSGEKTKAVATAIDPDVMFMLLAAEIAGQREQYGVALEGYMEAAKRVNDPRFAERAAVIAMYMKDSPKTQEAVAIWLKQDAKSVTARKIAALSALRADNRPLAVEHLSTLIKTEPENFEATLMDLSSVLQKDGKLQVLYETLSDLAALHPNQISIPFVQALIALQAKNIALADQQIQKVLKVKPDWDKALMVQAQIAIVSGDMNKAKTLIKNASIKYPNNEKIKKLHAQLLIKSENYQEASEIYKQLLATNPKDTESEFTLALVYLELKQFEAAEGILTRLSVQPELQGRASFYLGKIAEQRKDITTALSWFDKITDGDFAFDASLEAVTLLAKEKQFDAAHTRLNSMISQFPKQKSRIVLLQAELYNQQKLYQKAFDVLSTALAEQADKAEFLYARALIAQRLKKQEIVEKDLKQLLAKEPNNVEALNALGYSLLDISNRYDEAEKYLQQAIKLRPDEAVIIDSYGWLQFKKGQIQVALEHLQRAYAKQQENEIAAHIAEVLWTLGRKEEAKQFFDKVFKNAPTDEYLLDFQRRFLTQ